MLQHLPDPEHVGENRPEVEITDLDSPVRSRKPAHPHGVTAFRVRIWMGIALIVAIILLVITVLASLFHQAIPAKVAVPAVPINYPVSLATANGVCYVSSTTGIVTAIRVRDGEILWHHVAGTAGKGSITIAGGTIYVAPLLAGDSTASTTTIEALRASDGSALWSRTLPLDSPSSFQLAVASNVVYVQTEVTRIDALRASDGSSLWHYTTQVPFATFPTIVDGMVYVSTQDSHLFALRGRDGFPLWTYHFPYPLQNSPVIMDSQIYVVIQKGGLDVLDASSGVLRWHYTPRLPAPGLYPQALAVHGVVFVLTQDGQLSALHTKDGSTIWRVALHATDILPSMIMEDGIIYAERLDGSIDAIAESTGAILWHYQNDEIGPELLTMGKGVLYLAYPASGGFNTIGSVTVLRASDGFVLWHVTPGTSAVQLVSSTPDNLVLVALLDGTIRAFQASNGALQWQKIMN